MNSPAASGVYGSPPDELAATPAGARQFSPLAPGALDWSEITPGTLGQFVMLAPPGTLERRYVLAQALTALMPGAALTALAPKDKGGSRIGAELKGFGCKVEETGRRHHRICVARRPETITGAEEAIGAGSPRLVEAIGLWSQPGVFSWDRIDPGSALLASRLPKLSGKGADLGCGVGFLALAALKTPAVGRLDLVDIDRRAVEAARRNITDPRAQFHWTDAADGDPPLDGLDFIVMNPPFHDAGQEDRGLGQAFIRRAARALRTGGACWLVANRHLPYETVLSSVFKSVRLDHEAGGYKVYEARK